MCIDWFYQLTVNSCHHHCTGSTTFASKGNSASLAYWEPSSDVKKEGSGLEFQTIHMRCDEGLVSYSWLQLVTS